MRARKCDRCGKFYDQYGDVWKNHANAIKFVYRDTFNQDTNITVYDLCPECLDEAISFIKEKK